MAKISKDTFKKAVKVALEERGYTFKSLSMSLFGLQCEASFKDPRMGIFGKSTVRASYEEKNGSQYLRFEHEDGTEWSWEIPEGF